MKRALIELAGYAAAIAALVIVLRILGEIR